MALCDHVSALDELTTRLMNLRSALDSSIEGLLGPTPKEASDGSARPARSGINGELQDRIEGLLHLTNMLESQAAMIGDLCIDHRKGRGSLVDSTMPRQGY